MVARFLRLVAYFTSLDAHLFYASLESFSAIFEPCLTTHSFSIVVEIVASIFVPAILKWLLVYTRRITVPSFSFLRANEIFRKRG